MSDLEPTGDIPLDSIHHMGESPDGSSDFFIGEKPPEEAASQAFDFNENIAERLDDKDLNTLSAKLLELIDQDRASRAEWQSSINNAKKYLGTKIDDYVASPIYACGAFDSTMLAVLLKFWSIARAELFPMKGPAESEVLGSETDEVLQQANRSSTWTNYYLRFVDKPYYSDSERMLMYVLFYGSGFRKVYQDPILNRPMARFIEPEDFIVNNNTVSILESSRVTQQVYLNRKELLLLQLTGVYRKVDIPEQADNDTQAKDSKKNRDGVNTKTAENKSLFLIYETHADLEPFKDIDDGIQDTDKKNAIPLPYIVTICASSKEILAIRRNWKQDDPTFKRNECFVHYQYLPGWGLYGWGIAHTHGSNAIAATCTQRQLIDKGALENYPGGFISKGLKIENNNKLPTPGEWVQIETDGIATLRDSTMPMPYGPPSVVLKDLRQDLVTDMQNLGGIMSTAIAENRPDAPVGTTVALLEENGRLQSSILRSLHMSLTEELGLLAKLFGEYLGDSPYPFSVEGQESVILRTDFNDNVRVFSVSDPNLTTSTQRIVRAEALLKLASSAPQIHDLREAYERMYRAMNVEDIEKLLPPPPPQPEQTAPLDPVTEVMNAMTGKPIVAAMWQDHPAHVMVKMAKIQEMQMTDPQGTAQASAALSANIAEHNAMQYVLQMQMQMGIQLPPLEELKDPNIQNEIAIKAAEVAQQQMAEMQGQQQAQQPLDPNVVMMADIEQKKEATMLKDKTDQQKIELEAYKVQMNFESEKHKMDIQYKMADEKNQVTLAIAGMKKEDVIAEKEEALEDSQNTERSEDV